MSLRRRPRGRILAALAAGIVVVVALVAVIVVLRQPVPVTARTLRIGVVDGPGHDQHVSLDATFFTPPGGGRVPAILLAHGFGETKDAVRAEAEQLARAGFAVLTWSARGFGRSTGQVALDSPDYEVKDVGQLVSWLARQPRVMLDGPGDPRVGITGASYGGAVALLAAAYDHRIDAIVPQTTWYNLASALFPDAAGGGAAGGVFKKQWAGLLFTQGTAGFGPAAGAAGAGQSTGKLPASGVSAALCGRFLPALCAMYQQVATLGRATPQAISLLGRSSPSSVASRIDVPTLLIQGEDDSLFGLDQANANDQAIRRNGAPVGLVWFAGGHDGGNQETGRITQLTTDWFDRWLKSPHPWSRAEPSVPTGQPAFAVTRNLGYDPSSGNQVLEIATAPGYPGLAGSTRTAVRLRGPAQTIVNPPGGAPPSLSGLPGLSAGGPGTGSLGVALAMPGESAAFTSAPLAAPLQQTGSATVRVRVSGAADMTVFAEVYDVDQAGNATLPFQLAAPVRVTGAAAGRTVTVTLPAMDYQFAAGHHIRLVVTSTDFGYATSPAAAAYRVALAGPGLSVPSDPALRITGGGVPWWTWAAPVAALAAAAVILLARPRTRRAGLPPPPGPVAGPPPTPVPAGAPVPLEITGLTKRYRDGQLAVDGLSLRVERGQILGLLGPNGAGKTTTLRALMGLLYPDAGTITIFGQQVRPGAPALSRLGSFVEGPGFLPHLSGRANLDLYWRATGRPAAGSHLDEVLRIAGLGSAVDRRVRSYSRGMSQRLAIAQAMLGLPDLLVLDEPMNGLDPPQIREMRDVLLGYAAAGRTVILSSHLLGEVEQTCTHLVVMHHGRGLAAGPVTEITGGGAALVVGTSQAQRAVSVLRDLDGIEAAEPHPDGVVVHPNGVAPSAVVAALVGAGIPVDRVGPGRGLEDAFLALIGAPEGD
ncbi:MAG: type transport system ATP-binding protein [Streptosporangiaceae bacterium]|nr:type transport system ATP-binding protein [Streptosporangiaceae bacterium]